MAIGAATCRTADTGAWKDPHSSATAAAATAGVDEEEEAALEEGVGLAERLGGATGVNWAARAFSCSMSAKTLA